MATSRKGGGGKGPIGKILWFFLIASLIFAFYKVPTGRETNGLGDILVAKSATVEQWVSSHASLLDPSQWDLRLFQ